jgi:hypothetical protein
MDNPPTIKPARSILDGSFRYVPAAATSVFETWSRFGWRPMTDAERKRRRSPTGMVEVAADVGNAEPSASGVAQPVLRRSA